MIDCCVATGRLPRYPCPLLAPTPALPGCTCRPPSLIRSFVCSMIRLPQFSPACCAFTSYVRHATLCGITRTDWAALYCRKRLDLCAGEACTKLCAGCRSYRSRRVFRPPGIFLENDTPKRAAELGDCPCRRRAPQRIGVRVRVIEGSAWSRVGLGRRARLKLTTHKVSCRPLLH